MKTVLSNRLARQAGFWLILSTVLTPWASAAERWLFWSHPTGIGRSTLDGMQPVVQWKNGFQVEGLAASNDRQRLYWTDLPPTVPVGHSGAVRVSTFDGSHDETLVNQLPHPSALTVDDPNGLVYWTDVETMEILRSPLGNSSAETVLPARIDVSDLGGLAIDSDRDLLYFSYVNPLIDSLYPGSIGRLDLTTKTVETVVNGLSRPRGVALADGHLFWADDLLGTGGVIGRSDLATGEKTLIVKELQSPEGLAIDLTSQQLYWTDTAAGAIERANFDGSDPRQILIGLDRPSALAIAVVPEPSSALLLAVGWLTCMVALCRPSRRG